MASKKLLVYLMRRDLRVCDNPILHHLGTAKEHGFTHLLPVYVFPAHQVEVSGFIDDPDLKSPYPEARSRIGKFWRCGPHRAKFLAQSVWGITTSPELALVMKDSHSQKRSRFHLKLYGAPVVVPMAGVGSSHDTFAQQIAELSRESCEVVAPPTPSTWR
jgi:hypothetical protein